MSSSRAEIAISGSRAAEVAELAKRLTPRARETFDRIAGLVAEGHDEKQIAAELGLDDPREIARAMDELTEELEGLRFGATLPGLADTERAALRESLREFGQLVPVLVDERGEVLDGSHRLELLRELGQEPDVRVVELGGDEARRRRVRIAANTVRRMLSAGARTRAIRQELVHDPERSDRSIAALLGVANHTVAKVRRDLEEQGQLLRLETRVGADGKRQKVVKKTTAAHRPPPLKQERPFEYRLRLEDAKSYGGIVVFESGRIALTLGEPEWRKLGMPRDLIAAVRSVP